MFFSCTCGTIFPLNKQAEFVSHPQRSRRMSCRPNPSPDSGNVWLLYLPIELSLHILRSSTVYFFFSTAVFFPFSFIFRLPTTQFSLLSIHNLLICVLFRPSNSSMQCTNTYLHICLCAKPLPPKPTTTVLMEHVSNACSTSTSWYRPLPSPSLGHVLFAQLLWRVGPPTAYRRPHPILVQIQYEHF